MVLSNDLISQFVKITNDKETTKKETTVYGEIVEYNDSKYVKLDGSELLTPVSMTTDAKDGERVTVLIKNHTATVTGNISSPSARTDDVKNIVLEADAIGKKITEFEIAIGDKIDTEQLNAVNAQIETLNADNVTIKQNLTARDADIDNLQADVVKVNETLTAQEAVIESVQTDKLDAELAEVTYATIKDLDATDAEVYNLNAAYGKFADLTAEQLNAHNADIQKLKADKLDAATANITYAKIADLQAEQAKITDLEADVADIDTLIFGSASGNIIQTSFANAVIAMLGNAQIKSAMIDSVSADKITAGDIITNNVRVRSEDGSLVISDETMQISDENRVRVQIGKDASGDYSINVWDANGNLMFSEGGITDNAIKEAIIRNDMVSDDANIAAHKLDIDSLFEEINGSLKTIKSSKVYLDDEKQTLDVAFESVTTNLNSLNNNVSSQGTQLSVLQGQVASRVWKTDIDTAVDEVDSKTETLSTKYTELNQELDGLSATVASHKTIIDSKADSTTVTKVNDRVATLEASLDGFESTVGETYATKYEVTEIQNGVNNLEIGGRNLLLNSKVFKGSNITWSAPVSDEIYKGFTVRTYDNTASTTGYVDIITFKDLYADELGASYTFSFYAKGTGETRLCTYFYGGTDYVRVAKVVQSNGTVSSPTDGASYWSLTEDWKRYWVTWTLKDEGDISIVRYVMFRLWFGGSASICGCKLEKGDKATDWTPAPEDVDSDIAIAQAAAEAAQAVANQNAENMADIVTAFNSDIDNLQTQIDGSITTWFYAVEPTNSNEPAVNWTTTELKNVHLGDLYYDTVTGYCYRYQVKNNTYSWNRITDTDVTKALADAKSAQDTADQKRRVFYTQPTIPYDKGDLWVQGSGGDILRCQTAKIAGQAYSSSDWIPASKYTDDTKANAAAQQAATAHQAAMSAQDDIDNLKIGGRNLLFNSRGDNGEDWVYTATVVTDDVKGFCVEKQNTTTKEQYIGTPRTAQVEPSTEYTFSADIWCNEYLTNFDFFWLSDTLSDHKTGQGYVNIRSKPNQKITANTWTRMSWTFTTNADDYTGFIRIDSNATTQEGTASIIRVANLKLEKGNRATDWTPAPEDLENRVSETETQIKQTKESVTSIASRTTNVENKFAGYSTTEQMNSAIKQSADGISSSVSATYTTKTDFNNLEIGGRNLVAGTDNVTEYVGNATGATNGYKDVWSAKTIDIPTGTDYIISFDAKADVAQTIRCHFFSPNTTTSSVSSTGQRSTSGDGHIDVSITTEWARYWIKWTQGATDARKNIIVGRNFTTNDIYIRAVKFEAGHKPTDWTPAPEDMATGADITAVENSIDATNTRVSSTESTIQQLSESIMTLVRDENGESLMVQTENGWTFSTAQIQSVIDETSKNLDDLTNSVGDVTSAVDVLKQAVSDLGVLSDYVKITTYENEPCIELGETDSDFKLFITNTRIMFTEGTSIPAYINNQSLFINKAVIEEELQQGEFVWKARSNGNLGLIWKGASS